MALSKPARLNAKWWKENYPKSMPPNKELDDLIKAFDANPPAATVARIEKMIKNDGKSFDVEGVIKQTSSQYDMLRDQLKRTKAMLTKAKHDELAKMIDAIAEQVRKEGAQVGKDCKAAHEALREETKVAPGSTNWGIKAKEIEKTYFAPIIKAHGLITKLDRDARQLAGDAQKEKKEKATEMAVLIGKNRSINQSLQKLLNKLKKAIKEAEQDLKKDPGNLDALSFQADAKAGLHKFAAVVRAGEMFDKELVKLCVAAFGADVGKKLFMAAKVVEVKL